MRILATVMLALVVPAATPAYAQQSRCADCHFATPNAPNPRHVSDWDLSAHGRNDVGCEKCHGGDPSTFERFPAHASILRPGNVERPTSPRNLPRTCGRCHTGEYAAFRASRHLELLQSGDTHAPTCATCHGEVAAYLPSPKALERECRGCHGAGKPHANPLVVTRARQLLEGVVDVRASLGAARSLIKRIKSGPEKQKFEELYRQAEVPIIEAVDEAHAFVFDNAEERLAVARKRTGALLEQLANRTDTP